MKYEELNNVLPLYFPNLKQLIDSEMDTYRPGPHVLYGNILNPYVKMILEHEDDQAALKQIFSFYVELAISED